MISRSMKENLVGCSRDRNMTESLHIRHVYSQPHCWLCRPGYLGRVVLRRVRVPERAQGSLVALIIEKQVNSDAVLSLHSQATRRAHTLPRKTRVSFDASSGRSCQLSTLTREVHVLGNAEVDTFPNQGTQQAMQSRAQLFDVSMEAVCVHPMKVTCQTSDTGARQPAAAQSGTRSQPWLLLKVLRSCEEAPSKRQEGAV